MFQLITGNINVSQDVQFSLGVQYGQSLLEHPIFVIIIGIRDMSLLSDNNVLLVYIIIFDVQVVSLKRLSQCSLLEYFCSFVIQTHCLEYQEMSVYWY